MDVPAERHIALLRVTIDSDAPVARRLVTTWSDQSSVEAFLRPPGFKARYDRAGTTSLDANAAARAVLAVVEGAVAPCEMAGVIEYAAADAPDADINCTVYVHRAPAGPFAAPAAAASGAAPALSNGAAAGGAAPGPGGASVPPTKRSRKREPWFHLIVPALDRSIPRDHSSGKYLLERDGHGATPAGLGLTPDQRAMVRNAYAVAARWMAQQPAGAVITDLRTAASKLKSEASKINTGARKVADEEQKRQEWRDGRGRFEPLKASFAAGREPALWGEICRLPTLAEAEAAMGMTLNQWWDEVSKLPLAAFEAFLEGLAQRQQGHDASAGAGSGSSPPGGDDCGPRRREQDQQREQEDSMEEKVGHRVTFNRWRPSAAAGRVRLRGDTGGAGGPPAGSPSKRETQRRRV